MLLRESLGISADGTEKAFPLREVEAMLTRKGPVITYNRRDPTNNTMHVVIACDPSGGGASAFSICSIAQDRYGFINVRPPAPLRTNGRPSCPRAG